MTFFQRIFRAPVAQRAFSFSLKKSAPSQIYYTKNHEWLQLVDTDSNIAKVGISSYAADKIGELSYCGLEEVQLDEVIEGGEDLIDVESVKAADTVKMPVTGKIVGINEDAIEAVELVSRSPEADGWLAKIEVEDMSSLEELMDKDSYDKFVESDNA